MMQKLTVILLISSLGSASAGNVRYNGISRASSSSNGNKGNRLSGASGGLGLEEVVLFLIGLGVAAALGLAIVVGPLFALFFTAINGIGGNGIGTGINTINTSVSGRRKRSIGSEATDLLADTLLKSLSLLDTALRKYSKFK